MPSLVLLALTAVSDAPSPERIRQAVEASLVYMQDDAQDWMRTLKCATCHHMPMLVWTANEAKARVHARRGGVCGCAENHCRGPARRQAVASGGRGSHIRQLCVFVDIRRAGVERRSSGRSFRGCQDGTRRHTRLSARHAVS